MSGWFLGIPVDFGLLVNYLKIFQVVFSCLSQRNAPLVHNYSYLFDAKACSF